MRAALRWGRISPSGAPLRYARLSESRSRSGLSAETGAVWDATRLRRRLRDMGVRRRRGRAERPAHGWEALTPSEIAVVEAITSGMTNREAAAHLFLSPHTVSTHMRHVFQKLQINSRVELARIAADHSGERASQPATPATPSSPRPAP